MNEIPPHPTPSSSQHTVRQLVPTTGCPRDRHRSSVARICPSSPPHAPMCLFLSCLSSIASAKDDSVAAIVPLSSPELRDPRIFAFQLRIWSQPLSLVSGEPTHCDTLFHTGAITTPHKMLKTESIHPNSGRPWIGFLPPVRFHPSTLIPQPCPPAHSDTLRHTGAWTSRLKFSTLHSPLCIEKTHSGTLGHTTAMNASSKKLTPGSRRGALGVVVQFRSQLDNFNHGDLRTAPKTYTHCRTLKHTLARTLSCRMFTPGASHPKTDLLDLRSRHTPAHWDTLLHTPPPFRSFVSFVTLCASAIRRSEFQPSSFNPQPCLESATLCHALTR